MIQRLYNLLQLNGRFLGLLLTFLGSFFQLLYLSNVEKAPFYVLEIGVAMIVVGIILSFKMLKYNARAESFFLLSVYIMYLAVTIMVFVRFDTFSGVDNLREYRAAEITLNHGWNTPGSVMESKNISSVEYFLSCLSVTILPAIFSVVSGLGLITVFEFGLNALVCLTPILVYLNVREVFGRRELAALSAILYSQLYFVFNSFNTRQSIAILFLLCALLIFFKLIKKQRRTFVPLLCLFIFGIVSSHYTIAYSSIVLFFVLMLTLHIVSKLTKKRFNLLKIDLRKPYVDIHFARYVFTFCVVLSLAWFSFVPTSPFFWNVYSMARGFVPNIPSPGFGQQTKFISGSPLGPLVDNWFRLGVVLVIAGCIFLAFKVKKSLRMLLWLFAGGLFLFAFLTTFIPYFWLAGIEFTRVYRIGFPFMCVFSALILLALDKKSKGIILILFLLLNLPMNMLLPIHYRYVLYHSEESVSPDLAVAQVFNKRTEFVMSEWMRKYAPNGELVTTDQRGWYSMYNINNKIYLCHESLDFDPEYPSKYLVLHYFAIRYGLWVSDFGLVKRNQTYHLIDSNNVVYNVGQGILLMNVNSTET